MIHRVNSVAPDLDDRVIKPNQARSAKNLRFGSSTDDSNLSGGILVNGMSPLAFNPNVTLPDGSVSQSYVIGTKEDYENSYLYYAIYSTGGRSGANHGILQINTKTDVTKWVVRGSWLNFDKNSNVSMAVIDGKLYWTDGINDPRMVNVAKAIRTFNDNQTAGDVYPIPNESNLWCFTQIKRNPQHAPEVVTTDSSYPPPGAATGYWFTTDITEGYSNKSWMSQLPYQFSYYYIYDNAEESRLAPWSDCTFYIQNLRVSIPMVEVENYCNPKANTIIKNIVVVMRNGDTGTVYSIKKWDVATFNIPPVATGTQEVLPTLDIPSATSVSKIPTPASVYDQRYDSVPLVSSTNEVANNILNHGNVALDYTDFGSVAVTTAIASKRSWSSFFNQSYPPNQTPTSYFKTFRPSSNYSVGYQLIDEYGRCSPVLGATNVTIPEPIVIATKSLDTPQGVVAYANGLNPTTFNDDVYNNQYSIQLDVEGALPSWAKYIRPCYTRNNTVNNFHKTVARIYYWYENGAGETIFMRVQNKLSSLKQNNGLLKSVKLENEPRNIYTFKGYGIELSSDIPFLYTSNEEQYVKISREYYASDDNIPNTGATAAGIEYRIKGQSGAILLLEENFEDVKFYTGYQIGLSENYPEALPLWYQIEIFTKKKEQEVIYYDSTVQISRSEYEQNNQKHTFFMPGDCYMAYFNKNFKGQTVTPYKFINYVQNEGYWYVGKTTQFVDPGYKVNGYFYSENLTNIYSEQWQSGLGLENIAQSNNTNQQPRLNTSIVFSNQLVRGTQVNGLNKFNPLNIRQAPAENGSLVSLVVTNSTQKEPGVVLAIGTLGITSFYYGAIQLVNVDGSSNLATTDSHMASQRPLLGQFGTSQPGSITKNPLSTVYWWSDVVNDFIRYTNAGLERLGLTFSFGNKLRNEASNRNVTTVYDQVMDEAVLIPQGRESFVFSERFKTFQGYRQYIDSNGFTPERAVGMSLKTYYFLNGYAYVSTIASPKNQFFDIVANPEVTLITNEYPTSIKQWNSIKVYGPKPTQTHIQVGEAEGFYLETKISPSWWIKRKGEYDAAIRRAIVNNSNGMEGKVMESRILYSTFVFDPSVFDKLNFIEVKSNNAIVQ